MIQVRGFIHQLDIGEAEKKKYDGNAVFISKCYTKGCKTTDYKQQVSPFSQRLYPLKTQVGKMEVRLDVELEDPSIGRKANDAPQHQNPE